MDFSSAEFRSRMSQICVAPHRLRLDTRGVQPTVSMLRGVWGAALHELDADVYGRVFAGESRAAQGQPPGYVLRPTLRDAGCGSEVEWILLGDAVRHASVLYRAWEAAAERGLGPARRRFEIRQVAGLTPEETAVEAPAAWALDQAHWPLPDAPQRTPCRLFFPGPLRLIRDNQLVLQPTLTDIIVAACRRLRSFLPWDAQRDWTQVAGAATDFSRQVPQTGWTGRRLDLQRYSARQDRDLRLHGIAGWLDLPQGPAELWPLLAVIPWLHVGKGTVFGLGRLRIWALQS